MKSIWKVPYLLFESVFLNKIRPFNIQHQHFPVSTLFLQIKAQDSFYSLILSSYFFATIWPCSYFHLFCIFSDHVDMEQKTRITVAFISSRGLDQDEMEEDEEEEDDDDDDFDFSTAGIKSKLPGKRIVEMKVMKELVLHVTVWKVLESCRIFLVKCRLPWTWQWMRVRTSLSFFGTNVRKGLLVFINDIIIFWGYADPTPLKNIHPCKVFTSENILPWKIFTPERYSPLKDIQS